MKSRNGIERVHVLKYLCGTGKVSQVLRKEGCEAIREVWEMRTSPQKVFGYLS